MSPPITLVVGRASSPSPRSPLATFYVHAELLTNTSNFFRAAFDNHLGQAGFTEASTLVMRLPEERPEDISYLLQWIYRSGYSIALYHHLVDPALAAMESYNRERAVVLKAERHGDISELIGDRPGPPAFGPLVRLWLLAERLSCDKRLKVDICRRVREVGKTAVAVPGRDDVWRLWEGMPNLALKGVALESKSEGALLKGHNDATDGESGSGEEYDLKTVVLDMYADMKGWRVFEESTTASEDEEGYDWHPLFMRDLVVHLLRDKATRKVAVRTSPSTCLGGKGEQGGKAKGTSEV